MSNPLLSVIVPVYNVEKYLNKSVESILNQTYKELEIILVDDGSTDDCGKICDSLAQMDARIKVIHKANGGLSSARNAGLDVARGEYLAFVDSDDWLHESMYELLMQAMQDSGADISFCDINYVTEGDTSDISISQKGLEIFEGHDRLHILTSKDCQVVSQWNKIYKRYIFEDLRFPEGRLHEDVFVAHEELYKAKKVVYLDLPLYNYLQRSGSIMNTDEKLTQVVDAIMGYKDRIEFFEEKNEEFAEKEAVSMLYEYCRWKYDSYYDAKNKDNAQVLLKALRDSIKQYQSTLEPTDELKLVAFRNHKYISNKTILGIKSKIKGIISNK